MFYTVYKITNKINEKFYIGMHKTTNIEDGYMGSGILIIRAIQKYGLDNFKKEILHVFDNEIDMKKKEKELVILSEQSYNLLEGGLGGFGYINKNNLGDKRKAGKKGGLAGKGRKAPWVTDRLNKNGMSEKFVAAGKNSFKGKKHTDETKTKISLKNSVNQKGQKNSQYGTCWVTNGSENKKIKKEDIDKYLKIGYKRGRIIRG